MSLKKSGRGISIKTKLTFYFALFTVFVLLVVWIFQVLLLGRFYEKAKLDELHEASVELSACLDDLEALKEKTESVLSDSLIFSKVYRIDDGYAYRVLSQDFAGDYYLKTASPSQLEELFNKANHAGGTYYMRQTVKVDPVGGAPAIRPEARKELVYVQIVESRGQAYIIMLNMIYTPLGATINTLQLQFIWITMILLAGALILSYIISKRISTPIVRMNESARRLAAGDYNADFKGEGYRETRELADTLNYASSELSKVDNLQKELIANVSHDLRTPLTMITGYSEIMRDIPGENTPENVQVIIDESTRLTELVNDMLDLSRLQAGTARIEKSVFDLTETVRSTLTRYSKLTEHDGFSIVFEAEADVEVEADRKKILQVVYNLINNALNYSGDDKRVRVVQKVFGNTVRISVTDNGEGIAPEDLPLIWDRYYKVDRVHKRGVIGTGLGLTIVKGILEAHNCHYGVESELGQGSTFWFELPVVKSNGDR